MIDDNRSKDGRIMLHGRDGFTANFTPHDPNRHRKYSTYRLQCPLCPRNVLWSEHTVTEVMEVIARERHTLETVELPAPAGATPLRLLRAAFPETLCAESVTPGEICWYGTRYVIPSSILEPLVKTLREVT
ncbi:hypothetical protein [Mycobacterium marinum]|uniref:hypothetical protein n=1 Tax=Mycobacterium marinum TaxID=1781 RepID=UPI0021C4070A|nr:hypothetical protein [Mycobacterium marinum]